MPRALRTLLVVASAYVAAQMLADIGSLRIISVAGFAGTLAAGLAGVFGAGLAGVFGAGLARVFGAGLAGALAAGLRGAFAALGAWAAS